MPLINDTRHNGATRTTLASPILMLDTDLLAMILSYCDVSELLPLLLLNSSLLSPMMEPAMKSMLSMQTTLNFSFLLKRFPNSIRANQDKRAQSAICKFLSMLGGQNNHNCLRFECASLRNVTGDVWLHELHARCDNLTSLNLSGCANLSPDSLKEFLHHCPQTLKHLNLTACVRIEVTTVCVIATKHAQLQSLCLGGCSQQIGSSVVHLLFQELTSLQHFDCQGLTHVTDGPKLMQLLPVTLKSINLSGCEQLQNLSLALLPAMEGRVRALREQVESATVSNNNDNVVIGRQPPPPGSNDRNTVSLSLRQQQPPSLTQLYLDGVGSPRRGLSRGMLAYFSLGRSLQEVHLAGCEQIQDWEVQVLAIHCGSTLKCLQMQATEIGDVALQALGTHCPNLMECDVSACFRITNQGILNLCNTRSQSSYLNTAGGGDEGDETQLNDRKRQKVGSVPPPQPLRVLKISSLPNVSDAILDGITNLKCLHVLDVHDCPNITTSALSRAILTCLPRLIEVNAKGIANDDGGRSLPVRLRTAMATAAATITTISEPNSSSCCGNALPTGLRFVNQRTFVSPFGGTELSPSCCCRVRLYSQRLSHSVPMNTMIHCIDCGLLPELDRGVCSACASTCHKHHRTFVGAWTRFYCDCPFVTASCKTIFPEHKSRIE